MRHSARPLIVAAGLTALALSLSGCEKGLGGGGRSTPTVTIKIDSSADAAAVNPADVEVAGYGTLKGRVVVTGTPPTLPATIQQSQIKSVDAAVCVYGDIPKHENFEVGTGGELANVFIFLANVPPGAKNMETPSEPVKFDQKTCTFHPHCLLARTGQTILVLNSDSILHNTHTYPSRNTTFNTGVKPGTDEANGLPLVYQRAERGPVKVACDIHPWMGAYQLPLDHPYAALTAADGAFEISDLPAGTHDFTIWHEVAGTINSRYEVTIEPDATTEVELTIDAGTFASFHGNRPKQVVLSAIP